MGADTLAKCRLSLGGDSESLSSYAVLRDGDRLFSRYRLTEGRDYEETDDIFMKKFEGDDLTKLSETGVLEQISKALSIEPEKIVRVSFFGILEIEDDDNEDENSLVKEDDQPTPPTPTPTYLMEIYKVSSSYGVFVGTVGKPVEKSFIKCTNSRFFRLPKY